MMLSRVSRRGTSSLAAAVAVTIAAAGLGVSTAAASLAIDVTTTTGGKTATAAVGDTLSLKIYAVVTGSDGTGANDGFQSAQGSFLSTGSMKGSLSATLINPFTANGSQTGAVTDLDSDGDVDVGSNNNSDLTGFWYARSDTPQSPNGYNTGDPGHSAPPSPYGTVEGASYRVQLGTLSFTVTATGSTSINFRPRSSVTAALWFEDVFSPTKNPSNGTFTFGSPVTVTTVPPTREWILNSDTGANWSAAANWSPATVPTGAGAVANFLSTGAAGGNRTISVDSAQTVGTINFNPAANSYTLNGPAAITLDTLSGNAAINVTNGNDQIAAPIALNKSTDIAVTTSLVLSGAIGNLSGRTITKTGPGTLTLNGVQTHGSGAVLTASAGTLNLNIDGGNPGSATAASSGGNLTVNANAATHFASSQHLAALTVGSGATANLLAGGARVLNLNGLTIAGATNSWTGKLDLADNDLIVHASAGTVASVAATITNQVKAGINVGGTLWAGNGITTSLGGTGAGSYGALGVLLNDFASLGSPSGPIHTNFSGEPVDVNSVLVKYTYFGDADLDGTINSNDYFQIDSGFLNGRTGWVNGDFDYSGSINSNDYFLIDSSFLGQSGALTPAEMASGGLSGVSAVPEPASIGFFGIVAIGLIARRGRKTRHLKENSLATH